MSETMVHGTSVTTGYEREKQGFIEGYVRAKALTSTTDEDVLRRVAEQAWELHDSD